MQVLEIGCGTGTTALIHAPYVNHILATDFSPNMIEIAREKAAAQGVKNLTFSVAAVDDLKIPTDSMDMVMAHSILHLVDDRNVVINQIHSWLKPGGYFVSSTACIEGGGLMRLLLKLGHVLGLLPLVRFFGESELRMTMQEAGFVLDYTWRPNPKAAVFIIARKQD